MTAEAFDRRVLAVANEFLQTVVVVDDRAFEALGSPTDEMADDDEPTVKATSPRGRAVQSGLVPPSPEVDVHALDPKKVTDAFARDGLVCSVLSPQSGEDIGNEFVRTARRADLLVIDWVFNRDNGQLALDLVRKILKNDDEPERRRLRTIAIYTGELDLEDIAKRLAKVVDSAFGDCDLELDQGGFAMTKGPVRAAVFAKEHLDLPEHLRDRRVAFTDLPARLKKEFATLTNGLITLVALAGLAALREDTHRILRVLRPKLDAAYLGHRSALPTPDDSQALAVAMVASEIRSVLEDNDVGKHVGMEVLNEWLAKMPEANFGGLIDAGKPLTLGQVSSILQTGLGEEKACIDLGSTTTYGPKYFRSQVKPHATKVFSLTEGEALDSDEEFAHCTMMKTTYLKTKRILQLGTIVVGRGQYRLCVQPACDSVRLNGVRAFPFLRLERVEAPKRANYVVRGAGGKWVRLLLKGDPRDLTIREFDSGTDSAITAMELNGRFYFSDKRGTRLQWVGDLKLEFAQRVAVDLAQQFAQVAVEEAEFLRLSRRS